ncbi:MAG: HAD family hydrolase [Barnesiella sp.]|nr:HAD family hydrolase [Barnesiella sp.]
MSDFDSLIFDMDGTLWDAVDSYAKVWDATFADMNMDRTVSRNQLIQCMGLPIDKIYEVVVAKPDIAPRFLQRLAENEDSMMLSLGGKLYPGVKQYIPLLAEKFRLFMVSNCGVLGLPNFLKFTGLEPFFTDTLSFGQTLLPKEGNIRILIDKYSLKAPVYIGDTAGDCKSAHAAGIPMMLAQYGFGDAPDADFKADSFDAIANFFLEDKS